VTGPPVRLSVTARDAGFGRPQPGLPAGRQGRRPPLASGTAPGGAPRRASQFPCPFAARCRQNRDSTGLLALPSPGLRSQLTNTQTTEKALRSQLAVSQLAELAGSPDS
jgi:hypothetical protein